MSKALVAVLLMGCSGSSGGDDTTSDGLLVSPAPSFVTAGADRVLRAALPDGTLIGAAWSSSNPAVATVSDSTTGIVHGVAEGTVTITATSAGMTGRAEIKVLPPLTGPHHATIANANAVTCALASDGRAICFGLNSYFACGHPPYSGQAPVAPVLDDHVFTSITVGGEFSCGTTAAQTYCWGSNNLGVLGAGSNPPPPPMGESLGQRPVPVFTTEHFTTVVAARAHACALNDAGKMFCWGMGFGNAPVAVLPDTVFATLEAFGGRTCGLTPQRVSYCTGTATLEDSTIGDDQIWNTYTVGEKHVCALTDKGVAYCWGQPGAGNALGSTTGVRPDCKACDLCTQYECAETPQLVDGGLTFASLRAGNGYNCGLTLADGAAYCWGGDGFDGALGDGTATGSPVPRAVIGGLSFAQIVAGDLTTCGVTAAGALYCWGSNSFGQVGDGNISSGATPDPRAVIGGYTFMTGS